MRYLTIFALLLSCSSLHASDIVGDWLSIDDDTGEVDSRITLEIVDGKLQGHVSEILATDAKPNEVCDKCSGEQKDKPMLGLVILNGFDCKARKCSNGTILDPRNGKVYSSRLKLADDNTLDVRGYIGTPLLGRTTTWKRAPKPTASEATAE